MDKAIQISLLTLVAGALSYHLARIIREAKSQVPVKIRVSNQNKQRRRNH